MRKRLGEKLVQRGVLSEDRLRDVLRYQQLGRVRHTRRLGSLLYDLGLVPEEVIVRALARQRGVPGACVASVLIPEPLASFVPKDVATACCALPVDLEGTRLRVAMADPDDHEKILRLALATGRRIAPCIAVESVLEGAIARAYGSESGSPRGPVPRILPMDVDAVVSLSSQGAPPLIPRKELFGHPYIADIELSPDGRHVAFIGRGAEGGRALFVAPSTDLNGARILVTDRAVSLKWLRWAFDGRSIIYSGDRDGDERFQIYAVDRESGRTRHLTRPRFPIRRSSRVDARVVAMSPRFPDEILVQMAYAPFAPAGVFRVHVKSARCQFVAYEVLGAGLDVSRYWADSAFRLKLCVCRREEGDVIYTRRADGWRPALTIAECERFRTRVIGFDGSDRYAFLLSSRENLAHVIRLDTHSGEREIVASPKAADIEHAVISGGKLRGVVEYHPRIDVRWFDPEFRREFEELRELDRGVPMVVRRSKDGRRSLVAFDEDCRSRRYYIVDRESGQARFLADARPELGRYRLAPMEPVTVRVRDGLGVPCYVSRPPRRVAGPSPLVVLLHGGPHARDYWSFDTEHQWLANRGYAVLSVNYRGSTGFGSRLRDAGEHWLAPEMVEDVVDATRWAIERGIAEPGRIAIMGASYGGFLALEGLIVAPELYSCAVDLFGVTNWRALVDHEDTARKLGLDRNGARAYLERRSPLFSAARIRKPVLVIQGTNDVRVPKSESESMADALVHHDGKVSYVAYSGEGHGFYRERNVRSQYAIIETFLAAHVGGRLEELGADLDGASLELRHGTQHIQGLDAFWTASNVIEHHSESGGASLNLGALDLSGLGLRELPPSIGRLEGLRTLKLSNNRLTSLPKTIGGLSSLELLALDANQLMTIPNEIGRLHRLRELDLRTNQLCELPASLRDLPLLRRLHLDGNAISENARWGFRRRVLVTRQTRVRT